MNILTGYFWHRLFLMVESYITLRSCFNWDFFLEGGAILLNFQCME